MENKHGKPNSIEEAHTKYGIKHANPGVGDVKKKISEGSSVAGLDHKIEINAISAHFIEKIWSQVEEDRKSHPPGLAIRDLRSKGIDESGKRSIEYSLSFLSDSDVQKWCSDNLKYQPDMVLNFLRDRTREFLHYEMHKWFSQRENASHQPSVTDRDNAIYGRLKSLLNTGTESVEPGFHIQRGINTAVSTIWGLYGVLTVVYKNQFQKVMTEKEFVESARNCLPLIYMLARQHINVFMEVQSRYVDYLASTGVSLNEFRDDRFKFSPTGLKLELADIITNSPIELENTPSSPRTGCPAMFTSGGNNKNVIAEMAEWFLDLAQKYYVPIARKKGLIR
jgi:hypothetical protein